MDRFKTPDYLGDTSPTLPLSISYPTPSLTIVSETRVYLFTKLFTFLKRFPSRLTRRTFTDTWVHGHPYCGYPVPKKVPHTHPCRHTTLPTHTRGRTGHIQTQTQTLCRSGPRPRPSKDEERHSGTHTDFIVGRGSPHTKHDNPFPSVLHLVVRSDFSGNPTSVHLPPAQVQLPPVDRRRRCLSPRPIRLLPVPPVSSVTSVSVPSSPFPC